MVYCGRPSTSCNNCRAKKRRCDKALPECGQCYRTGHECGGYRDPSSFIFHDESSKVIDKARSRATKRRTPLASQEYRPAERIGSHSLPEDALLRVAVQSTFSYEADSVFVDNDLPLDFFDDYQNTFTPNGASLESGTRDEGSSTRDDIGSEEGNNNNDGDGNDNNNEDLFNDQNTSNNEAASQNNNAIARPFSLPLDMIGLNFFLSYYVVRQSGPSSGFLDYTFAILAQEGGNEMLEGAILALGFTGLARTTQQQDLMHRSTMMYARTKERIKRALAEPHDVRKDSTIVTMLILALYEFSNNRSLENWKHHITGATSLLALRGKTQLTTAVGIQIFKDVFSHLLLSCIYVAFPMPPRMRMLRIEAAEAVGASDPYWVATGAAVELLDLYQHIRPAGYSFLNSNPSSTTSYYSSTTLGRSGTLNMPVQDLERHLSQALEIDQRLESLSSECSPEWQFAIKRNRHPHSSLDRTCVQGDVYHIYHDVWVANVWNLIRICRVLSTHAIGHLVLRTANADGNWFFSNQYADRLQQVSRIMMSIRDDILASVPQQMGYVASLAQEQQQQHLKRSTTGGPSSSGIQPTESSSAASSSAATPSLSYSPSFPLSSDQITYTGSAIGGYFASWALVIVGSLHCLEDEARAWTVAQLLEYISKYIYR
ncbi:C6 finger domain protein [Halenospora varia]|nr:C6 finger domain protein [Halenospora varia]